MKKVLSVFVISCFIGFVSLVAGCGQKVEDLVKANMAEISKVYYIGECADFYCSVSSGQREDPYLMNGDAQKLKDFALVSVAANFTSHPQILKAKVFVDEQVFDVELEINGLNQNFMADLEVELVGDEKIEIAIENTVLKLENMSNSFGVDCQKAIEIACFELKNDIQKEVNGKKFGAECYLRILDKKANNFDQLFWSFTILNTKGESFSVVFSTKDGAILAKSN